MSPVFGGYKPVTSNSFGFVLSHEYDSLKPVIIDPVLSYSTYLGGSSWDWGNDIAVDDYGNAYVAGMTESWDFPTLNPVQTDQAEIDGFVAKLGDLGDDFLYSTYLGGSHEDRSVSIAVDCDGNTYVAGYTISIDYPTVNGFRTDQPSDDAFVSSYQ